MQVDGWSFIFKDEHFKFSVLDKNDVIIFQLRDANIDTTKLNCGDNLIGEFSVKVEKLCVKYGETQDYDLTFTSQNTKQKKEAGNLYLLPSFINEKKIQDKVYDESRTKEQT